MNIIGGLTIKPSYLQCISDGRYGNLTWSTIDGLVQYWGIVLNRRIVVRHRYDYIAFKTLQYEQAQMKSDNRIHVQKYVAAYITEAQYKHHGIAQHWFW